jgi:hypothetical protein
LLVVKNYEAVDYALMDAWQQASSIPEEANHRIILALSSGWLVVSRALFKEFGEQRSLLEEPRSMRANPNYY